MAKSEKKIILCSACLLGIKCRYDGRSNKERKILKLLKREILIPVCPELLGGLSIPRMPARLTGSALEVLKGEAKVLTKDGEDITKEFIRGAKETLKISKILCAQGAIFKQISPSCGCGKTLFYNPTFPEAREIIKGDGVTTALLKRNGIKVISEEDLIRI